MRIRALIASAALAAGLLCFAVPGGSSATPAAGAELWSKRYNGPAGGTELGKAVVSSPDGTKVFSVGRSTGTDYDDYVTIAYNAATGTQSWAKRYNGPGNGIDEAWDVAVSSDGSKVFVTGESYGSSTTGTAYATVAYNAASGSQLWAKRYNGPVNGDDGAAEVAVSPDGTKVFVTGASYTGAATSFDYATVAYDASTGAQQWAKRYNGPANDIDSGHAIDVSGDGTKVFVTGDSYGGPTTAEDYATVAYSASTGAQLWAKRYNGTGDASDSPRFIDVGPTGTKVFVTGYSYGGSATQFDYATVAYNASTGSTLWASRYNGAGSKEDDAWSLAPSPDGTKVFVTGRSYGSAANRDYATVAYNASTGGKLWSTRYDGPGNGADQAFSVGVNPAGTQVFVTGESYGGLTTGNDGATVAYNASTGSKLWATRYDGPAHLSDGFNSLAVAGDGTKVFVTGTNEKATENDLLTVAYQG